MRVERLLRAAGKRLSAWAGRLTRMLAAASLPFPIGDARRLAPVRIAIRRRARSRHSR
jgi:hypothetical protein